MTRSSLILPIALLWGLPFAAQKPADSGALDAVLKNMDAAAASFRATQADFEWDRYEKVIDEVDRRAERAPSITAAPAKKSR